MSKLTYVFIRNNKDITIATRLIRNESLKLETLIFVLWNKSFEPYFGKIKAKCILINDYSKKIDFNPVRKQLLELIKSFPHLHLYDSKSLIEILEYDGCSLWWFIRQGLYEHFMIVMREVLIIQKLVRDQKVQNILILNHDKEFAAIVKEAIRNTKTSLSFTNSDSFSLKEVFRKKINLITNNFPRLIRVFQGFMRSFGIEIKTGKKNILLFTQSHLWTTIASDVQGDANSYTVLREMIKSEEYNVISLDIAINSSAAWKGIKFKKKPFMPYDYFIFNSFFDLSIRRKLSSIKLKLRKEWKKIEESSALRKFLICNNVNLFSIFKPKLKSYFLSEVDSFIGAARNIEIAKKIIRKYCIDGIITIDENGTSRFLVFGAKLSNIPSLALQHGLIHPMHISYSYSKDDLYGKGKELECYLADKTAVYGRKFKELLIDNGKYRPERIAVTGQPRTDILFEQKKTYSKRDMFKKLGITINKKLVVFASQPLKDLSESRLTLQAIASCLKNFKDLMLVVKLHPNDNKDFYVNVLEDMKSKAIVIKEIDLYGLLYSSDLVLSVSSTVMLEALLMDKPVIQVNLFENYDFFGQLRGKAFLHVKNELELKNAIAKCLYDQSTARKLKSIRKSFIRDYYFAIDGKSAQRFLNVLNQFFQNK